MTTSSLESLSPDDKRKLDAFMRAGLQQLQEIDDIRGSLRDTAKGLAEEFGVKPKVLMMAARMAYKNDLLSKREEMDTVEDILQVTGNA
jgi:hypothetical protein